MVSGNLDLLYFSNTANSISPEASSSISDYLTLPSPDYLTNINTNNNKEEENDEDDDDIDDDNNRKEDEEEDNNNRDEEEQEEDDKDKYVV